MRDWRGQFTPEFEWLMEVAMAKKLGLTKVSAKPARGVAPLLADVRGLILAAREQAARSVNAGLTLLYWEIGSRIRRDILRQRRAEYGKQIFYALSRELTAEFGRGFSQAKKAKGRSRLLYEN